MHLVLIISLILFSSVAINVHSAESALSSEPIPMLTEDDLPERTPPLIEIGPDFLGTGNIDEGFELPTGAVWQPALWVFGDLRTGLNYINNGSNVDHITEWANRLDLFFNLRLSGTERILLGVQPLQSNGKFTSYTFHPDDEDFNNENNFDIQTLFFEGEIGEIFPNLDRQDRGIWDIGFAVGRQPLFFQEGMMLNDNIDAVGLTRDTLIWPGVVDSRLTLIFGWGDLHRGDNVLDRNAKLVGLFTEADFRKSTVAVDLALVDSEEAGNGSGDGFYAGASATQRIGLVNTSFRVNTSVSLDDVTSAVDDGTLLFGEISMSPFGTHNVVYLNVFWGIDQYRSAARDPTTGGPLGQTGILYSAVGLGRYPAALGNRADDSAGGSLGYQMFFNADRTQLTLEAGGRAKTKDRAQEGAIAIGFRLQHAMGSRYLLQFDGFAANGEDREDAYGLRTELRVQF